MAPDRRTAERYRANRCAATTREMPRALPTYFPERVNFPPAMGSKKERVMQTVTSSVSELQVRSKMKGSVTQARRSPKQTV